MQRVVRREVLPMLDLEDLNTICRFSGISVYREVLVVWDEDFDARVLGMIDSLEDQDRRNLFAVHEHEGNVIMFWRSASPSVAVEDGVEVPDGDYWNAEHFCFNEEERA